MDDFIYTIYIYQSIHVINTPLRIYVNIINLISILQYNETVERNYGWHIS